MNSILVKALLQVCMCDTITENIVGDDYCIVIASPMIYPTFFFLSFEVAVIGRHQLLLVRSFHFIIISPLNLCLVIGKAYKSGK